MATNDEIIAKLPAVLTKLQETNERAARDAALAEKRKLADLQKQQTIANKKGAAKTRADLDAIQELKDLRKDIKDREAQQAEIAKSSAGQAIALKKECLKSFFIYCFLKLILNIPSLYVYFSQQIMPILIT